MPSLFGRWRSALGAAAAIVGLGLASPAYAVEEHGTHAVGAVGALAPTPTVAATPPFGTPPPATSAPLDTPRPSPAAAATPSPGTRSPLAPEPSPAVEPTEPPDAGDGGLPVTGAQVGGLVVAGTGLVAAGIAMMAVRRPPSIKEKFMPESGISA